MDRGHSFESLGRETIIKVLNDHLLEIPTDYCEAANRSFKKTAKNFAIFQEMTKTLKKSGWANFKDGSVNAKQIEIDVLIHVHNPGKFLLSTVKGYYEIRPANFVAGSVTHNYLSRGISKEALDQAKNPNTYIVIEVTVDRQLVLSKLVQLERDLTFLLCRQRVGTKDNHLGIDQIVSYVGIATRENVEQDVKKALNSFPGQLPLVSILFSLGRFIGFDISFDLPVFIGKQFDRLNATHAGFKSFREETTKKLNEIRSDLDNLKITVEKLTEQMKLEKEERQKEREESKKLASALASQIDKLASLIEKKN
jgi:hypothetical protein